MLLSTLLDILLEQGDHIVQIAVRLEHPVKAHIQKPPANP
jgi:hypothetical protein